MSEEKKGITGKEDKFLNGSDDDHLSEISDGGYVSQGSNHSIDTSELDLELNSVDYVARGLEVAASDIMIIEHLPDGTCHEQNSDGLEPLVTYEHPSDLDEETGSQLSRAHFNNTCQERKISNFELNSLSKNYQKGKEKSLIIADKKRGKKMREISKGKNASDSHSNKPQVKDPRTQIYDFTLRREKINPDASLTDKKIFGIKCPDYGSDEFADVEDNARDSSDNGESFSDLQTMSANRCMTEAFPSKRTKQEQKVETAEERKFDKTRLCSSSSDSEMEKRVRGTPEEKNTHSSEKTNVGASCSYSLPNSSKRETIFSIPKTPEEGKKKKKCSLPTIAEESENERKRIQFKDDQPSHSKANPLKMKAKVGIRKDKCNVCRVRLGLCAIRCRCGGYYCAKHRYDKEHNCPFDYKTMGAEEIRRNNPQVIAEKVRKL